MTNASMSNLTENLKVIETADEVFITLCGTFALGKFESVLLIS